MMNVGAALFLQLAFGVSVFGGRILLYPYGHCLNSHLLNAEKIANMLLENGQDVSMLISDMYEDFDHLQYSSAVNSSINMVLFDAPQNYTPICEYDTVDFMMYSPIQVRFDAFIATSVKYCDKLLEDQQLLQSLKQQNFDVLVMEALDPCSRILADYLDIPFIPLITAGLGHWDGNPRMPSHLPAAIAGFTNRMSFPQRIANLLMKVLYESIPIIMGFDLPFEELKVKYNLNTSLSLSSTFDRAAIKLINSDFAIEYPAPVEPDSILIGGFSLEDPKPLPGDLEQFMQSAGPAGVVVMSTGTLVKSFDQYWTDIFATAFAQLEQKVIWRYYDAQNQTDMMAYRYGDNIKLMQWIPQLDLLAHPQTKLFITHCGLNGLFEAIYTGTPVIAAPMSGDQMNNAAKLTDHAQMGVKLDMFSLTSDTLYDAIQTVLKNPKYLNNALDMSARFRDQPVSTKDKLNYWVDYVIRHKGAKHLKSAARELGFVQYYSLDVIGVLVFLVVFIVTFTLSFMLYVLCYLKKYLLVKNKME